MEIQNNKYKNVKKLLVTALRVSTILLLLHTIFDELISLNIKFELGILTGSLLLINLLFDAYLSKNDGKQLKLKLLQSFFGGFYIFCVFYIAKID